jgi:hypothetical protein|tara:strand:- start:31 stop:342 length:312 start_codon:yes stop_codon:yes gene_type:complete
MKTEPDYKKQLEDYKRDDLKKGYSDKEIKKRIEEIEIILSKNFDELGQNLRIELSEETRLSIKDVIIKTNMLYDHKWEDTIRLLEQNYKKLPKKMRDVLESGN